MLLNNRPKGISINKNALNIQINNDLQSHQQQGNLKQALQQTQQPLDDGPLKQASKSPSPPQLKALRQPSENDDLRELLTKQQDLQLLGFEQTLKQQLIKPANKLIELEKAPEPLQQPLQPFQKAPPPQPLQTLNQGIKRERPKSLIPRLVGEQQADKQRTEEVEDIDQSMGRDAIFMVCDVAKDIYSYMLDLEQTYAIKKDHLKEQKIFTPKIRQRLISWCIDIHSQLKLLSETMYTTIAVLDRYFQNVIIKQQSQVQLVAIAATLIASKYEEIYPPEVDDLTYLTQNAYTKRDVLRMEIEILEKLKFDLGKPIPLAFLRRFSKAAHSDVKMHSISKYLMEISLPQYECSHWRPSMLAATALFITIYLTYHDNTFGRWNKTLQHYTTYTRQQLMEPAATLCKILKRLPNPNPKWPELKSPNVDRLIKICEMQPSLRS